MSMPYPMSPTRLLRSVGMVAAVRLAASATIQVVNSLISAVLGGFAFG